MAEAELDVLINICLVLFHLQKCVLYDACALSGMQRARSFPAVDTERRERRIEEPEATLN